MFHRQPWHVALNWSARPSPGDLSLAAFPGESVSCSPICSDPVTMDHACPSTRINAIRGARKVVIPVLVAVIRRVEPLSPEANRQTHRQTDGQTDTQTHTQTHRHTDTHTADH